MMKCQKRLACVVVVVVRRLLVRALFIQSIVGVLLFIWFILVEKVARIRSLNATAINRLRLDFLSEWVFICSVIDYELIVRRSLI